MNFPADHIERIKELGYTESEARFLYIVAVHSGYFTLGQFRAFTRHCLRKATHIFRTESPQARSRHNPRLHAPGLHLSSVFPHHLRADRQGQSPQPQTALLRFHAFPPRAFGLHSRQSRI